MKLTARERLEALFQPETFQETGMHIRHCGQHFGIADKELPADAVITGTGYVNGQLIAAVRLWAKCMRRRSLM